MVSDVDMETKVLLLMEVAALVLKAYRKFKPDVWEHIFHPAVVKPVSFEGMELEPSLWRMVQNLASMIPSMDLSSYPTLLSAYTLPVSQETDQDLESTLKAAYRKFESVNPITHLALSLILYPNSKSLCKKVFGQHVLPIALNESPVADMPSTIEGEGEDSVRLAVKKRVSGPLAVDKQDNITLTSLLDLVQWEDVARRGVPLTNIIVNCLLALYGIFKRARSGREGILIYYQVSFHIPCASLLIKFMLSYMFSILWQDKII